jgi:hypothetical protein
VSRDIPLGVRALSGFFVFGACASGVALVTLLFPGGPLDALWRVNPRGDAALHGTGAWGLILMALVCLACALTARGLWIGARWGRWLALAMLSLNLIGDAVNALVLGDLRTLVGLPVGGALIAYLLSRRVRAVFRHGTA